MIYHQEFHEILGCQWRHSHFRCQSDFASRNDIVTHKPLQRERCWGQSAVNLHFVKGRPIYYFDWAPVVHQHSFEDISNHHCPYNQGIMVWIMYSCSIILSECNRLDLPTIGSLATANYNARHWEVLILSCIILLGVLYLTIYIQSSKVLQILYWFLEWAHVRHLVKDSFLCFPPSLGHARSSPRLRRLSLLWRW